jgi:adenylosuccinate synthase
LDLVAVRHAAEVCGFTEIALTKMDILDGFSEIKICTAYRTGSKEIDYFPSSSEICYTLDPVYETLEGWDSTKGCRNFDDLPLAAREFISFLEKRLEIPVRIISTGPDSSHVIFKNKTFLLT